MSRDNRQHGWIEEIFETGLFSSRFLVLVAVLGILISSAMMFFKGSVEVIQGLRAIPSLTTLHSTSLDDKNVKTGLPYHDLVVGLCRARGFAVSILLLGSDGPRFRRGDSCSSVSGFY